MSIELKDTENANWIHNNGYSTEMFVSVEEVVEIDAEELAENAGNPHHDDRGRFSTGPGGGAGKKYSAKDAGKDLATLEKKAKNIKSFKQLKAYNDKVQDIYDKYYEANGDPDDHNDATRLMGDWTSGGPKSVDNFVGELASENHGKMFLDYQLTQEYFKAKGIKEITLTRGISGKQAKMLKEYVGTSNSIKFTSDPAQSWTDADEVSSRFANGNIIMTRKVPVKNVVSTYITNPGLAKFGENEFIVSDPNGYSLTGKELSYD